MKKVRTKKEFTKLIGEMEKPVLYHGDYGTNYDNISQSFIVKDDENINNKFTLLGCRYVDNEPLEVYEKREKKLIMKYEKWLYDIWGNYGFVVREN